MTDSTPTSTPSEDLMVLAMGKLGRVLGADRGKRVFDETMAAAQMTRLSTPEDLHRFSEVLARRGGIEAAVAGLLNVAAVMRGASPPNR